MIDPIQTTVTASIAGLTEELRAGLIAAAAGVKEPTEAMAAAFARIEESTPEVVAGMTGASVRSAEAWRRKNFQSR
jgi:hypothetical protein